MSIRIPFRIPGSNRVRLRLGASLGLLTLLGFLAGCPSNQSSTASLHGTLYGGRQPIAGAHVTAYASPPDATASTPAAVIGTATTGADGRFDMNFSPAPASGAVVFVEAAGGNSLGGNPASSANAAIALMTVAGIQDSTVAPVPETVNINELTTVAAAYSAGSFIGSSGIAGPASGVSQAAKTFANLVEPVMGTAKVPGASAAVCTGAGEPVNCAALRRMDTLANIAAACVNRPPARPRPARAFSPQPPPAAGRRRATRFLRCSISSRRAAYATTARAFMV